MPDPQTIKEIIDHGAYAAGAVQCSGPTVAWQAALGNFPREDLARKYIRAADALHEVSEALVNDLMDRASSSSGGAA